MDDEGTSPTRVSPETKPHSDPSFLFAQTSTSRQPREEKVSHIAFNFAAVPGGFQY